MKTLHAFVVLSRPTSYIGINITSILCMCYDLADFKNFPFACSVNSPKLLNSNMFLLGVIFLLCIVFFWALLMSYNITYLHNKFSIAMFSYIPVHFSDHSLSHHKPMSMQLILITIFFSFLLCT